MRYAEELCCAEHRAKLAQIELRASNYVASDNATDVLAALEDRRDLLRLLENALAANASLRADLKTERACRAILEGGGL